MTVRRQTSGFTLTEIAIVLGVIGLILGGIWVAASKVYQYMRLNKALSEADGLIQSARTLYGNTAQYDNAVLTQAFIAMNFFPADLVVNGVAINPWQTTSPISSTPNAGIEVGSQQLWGSCPPSPTSLQIVFWGLNQDETLGVLLHYIGPSHNDVDCIYADCLGSFTNPSSLTIGQLMTACSATPGQITNVVISVQK